MTLKILVTSPFFILMHNLFFSGYSSMNKIGITKWSVSNGIFSY